MDNLLLLIFILTSVHDITNINFSRKLSFSNLSKEEWSVVRDLPNRNDIVTKPANKDGAVVVWRTDLNNYLILPFILK